ncbi:PAS domain S-box protein [Mucilaginibacter sp. 21P]|uniref:PAS domain S-box protein n=1 Tax=Mucilaginibacter sp. 21P TaxID=2778902 RepID=UPI001C5A3C0A|nr:PAS domain S-box protein [Mucilaginibacter sp. 21P]QXV63822.1 PAS domain S-box protein [Mucilaginibacter sp. 21P]
MLSKYALQTMVDTLPIGTCVFTGINYTITAANEQMLMIWNKPPDIIGSNLLDAIPEIQGQAFFELLRRVYHTGETYRNPDGEAMIMVSGELKKIFFDCSFKPLRDKDGTIYGVVSTASDTSKRVLALNGLEDTVAALATDNEELTALNEEYMALNEKMEARSEELRVTTDELLVTQHHLERSLSELTLAEERIRLATEAIRLGTYDIDLETNQLISSPQLASLFGFTKVQDLPAYVESFHPDDLSIRATARQQALSTGRLCYEARIYRNDTHDLRWVKVEGKVVHDATGKPVRLIGTLMDVTEQKQTRDTERKLKTLADNSTDLMSILDLSGTNSYINDSGKVLLGFTSDEEVAVTPIVNLHSPEDLEFVQTTVLPTVLREGRWVGTMRLRHLQTGELFPVLNYAVRIDDPASGQPLAIGAIMRDLRPELSAKRALADSEQLLRDVTSAAPTALWMSDQEGNITYVNQTWIDSTGLSAEDSLGIGWLGVVDDQDRTLVVNTYYSALEQKRRFEVAFRFKNTLGTLNWYLASGQPKLDSQNNFKGFVGAFIDITEQKLMQQHKDDFISIASHELKTPITTLKASLQLMDRFKDKPDHPMLPKLILQSRKSTERVSMLIDDLLDVGRLQQKEIKLNKTTFIISQLVNACANPINIANRQRIRINGDLELVISADEHRIDQVVTNFLTNAVKYAPDAAFVDVTISATNLHAKVAVTDYGAGLPPEKLKHLFERYYRVNEDNQSVSGLGLGLYICKEIIERHQGTIGVDCQTGNGCTFWFTLPLASEGFGDIN